MTKGSFELFPGEHATDPAAELIFMQAPTLDGAIQAVDRYHSHIVHGATTEQAVQALARFNRANATSPQADQL